MSDGLIKGTFQDMYEHLPNSIRPCRIDKNTHSLVEIDYAHHRLHEGDMYSVAYSVANIGQQTTPADVISLDFTTPNTTEWLHGIGAAVCGGSARVVFMEAPTGGTETPTGQITPLNRNRNSTKVSGISVFNYDSTVGTGGKVLLDEYIGSGVKTGGDVRAEHEWILKQNTKYSLWIFSASGVPASLKMHWYEHTSKS
jgi:hypothetical protein